MDEVEEVDGGGVDSDAGQPVCLITGGSSGVGLAAATKFASKGFRVAFCARNPDRLMTAFEQVKAVASPESVLAFTHDLNHPEKAASLVDQVVSNWGRLDVLINNAAVAPLATLEETTDEAFEEVVNVNIRTPFYLTRAAWKQMQVQGKGAIVNMSSLAAVDPFPGFSAYGSSKAWIDLFTVALGNEGRKQGIFVHSVRAGAIETPLLRRLFPEFPEEQTIAPERVADVIWALAQREMQPASGQPVIVKA